ncbi:hypothetical protein GUJ93_ZPchr0013g34232 [Zizania palustris]|uniref:Uncharacterized protein n=1 Tax=Zizania palustris TaxID=103762 RepID=A0A8J5X335_ZIZPA|nr:hypothetical protein GUJ93_ZPchr0013g34232 [Zizania palustris]
MRSWSCSRRCLMRGRAERHRPAAACAARGPSAAGQLPRALRASRAPPSAARRPLAAIACAEHAPHARVA